MKRKALKDAGLRDSLKVTIGSNAVNLDAWSKNAAEAVKVCGGWV
jgi:methanogenic corrinoid protein MtbC1